MPTTKWDRCWIGTSGWSYAHWAKGRFYPSGLKPGEWLGFLAEHFRTVEVNSSFYRVPPAAMVARWRRVVGTEFRFAVKLWRQVTHRRKLANCRGELDAFLAAMKGLGGNRGPLLVQLPPFMGKDLDRLDAFLGLLREAAGRTRWRVAVEFRNSEWLDPEVYDLLDHHHTALVLADMPRCPVEQPNAAEFVYVRRHGPGGRYRGCYTPAMIRRDGRLVRGWLDQGREVFVYFNNDFEGHAVDNACQLAAAVGAP